MRKIVKFTLTIKFEKYSGFLAFLRAFSVLLNETDLKRNFFLIETLLI